MQSRPVIGLCAALERAQWGAWDAEAHLLPREYAASVARAGGLAVILPADAAVTADPDLLLDRIDGLVLAGGRDVGPGAYGADAHPATSPADPERDAFEIALARRAVQRDLPLLGICRGMQVLNVARGGTLLQHLPETQGHDEHRRTPGTYEGNDHLVRLDDGSLAARVAGEARHRTLSHHHQGVDRVGDGLVVSGRAEPDELAEAIELPGSTYVLGVQWHPEADETSRLIASLVDEARAYAGRSTRASSQTGNGGASVVAR